MGQGCEWELRLRGPRVPGLVYNSPLEGTRRHGRRVANAQLRSLPILLLEILLGERIKLCAVLLFDGRALSVELLDVVEPGDAVADPGIGRLEAILRRVS